MEEFGDFDVFTNKIDYTKQLYAKILDKFVNDVPSTPCGPDYQSGRKLYAVECLAANNERECAFHLSEAVSATLRIMAVYRDEQLQFERNKLHKITSFIKPVQDLIDKNPFPAEPDEYVKFVLKQKANINKPFSNLNLDDLPFHKRYLKFSSENNVNNLQRILKELPREWTIIQLTAPYNPNENIKSLDEYRTEINALYLTMFTNSYFDENDLLTVHIPANDTKEGEKPLFEELFSVLDENYKTIESGSRLNNKRLVQNYWSKREDIDLRMKSVILAMEKEWLGGWSTLLTGKLVDSTLTERIIELVDSTIRDWGFIRLTTKQKILLYNLIENTHSLSSNQIKSTIRKILIIHGNPEDITQVLDTSDCESCDKDFKFTHELCLKCLSKCFEKIHNFSLVDGIKAFSKVATLVKENDEWATLKGAKRHPVILIVDEILDTFPWETLPIINHDPITRIENIHFLYYLYKLHEENIVDGYLASKAEVGRYIINPEKNLDRMEKRMKSFVEYWCGGWSGRVGEPPPPADFLRYLAEADVFLYCGHGDGCHFANGGANGAGVEGASGARGVVLLSGCGSVRLLHSLGRAPPAGAHHHLHIAGIPMVVGMLWEVTDLEVDKMVSTLVSLYVPSAAPVPWPSVGKAKWSQGVLETEVEHNGQFSAEKDLLRAIARSRRSSKYVMIASSMVARGLPVRIV